MKCPVLANVVIGAVVMVGCGATDEAAVTDTAADTTVVDTSAVDPTQATALPSTSRPPAGDLSDSAEWLGRSFEESQMAAPFASVLLDGTDAGWVSALVPCGVPSPTLPSACPAFVRPDPGGSGHSLDEPGTWMVLVRQVDPQNFMAPGTVLDAVRVDVTEPSWMPTGMCRSLSGASGMVVGFVRYDPAYVPTGVEADDTAAHPVVKAWLVDGEQRLVEQPADEVECTIYSFTD